MCEKNIGKVPREAPGLPQSEITEDEEYHHNNTNNVENIVHVSSSFSSRDRITVEPDAHNTNIHFFITTSLGWIIRGSSQAYSKNFKSNLRSKTLCLKTLSCSHDRLTREGLLSNLERF